MSWYVVVRNFCGFDLMVWLGFVGLVFDLFCFVLVVVLGLLFVNSVGCCRRYIYCGFVFFAC